MDFTEFEQKVVKDLEQYFGTSVEILFQDVVKANDTVHHGVVVRATGKTETVAPVIYLDQYYEKLVHGGCCFEEVLAEIKEVFARSNGDLGIGNAADTIMNWEKVHDRVYPILLSADRNKAFLKGCISKDYMDLKIAYIVRLVNSDDSMATVKVNEDMLKRFGIAQDDLHKAAMDNLISDGVGIYKLEDILFHSIGGTDKIDSVETMDEDGMYCFSNKRGHCGAGCLLAADLLKKTANGRNCYIIPSSIHEILFLPDNCTITQDALDEMIRQVNNTEVCAEEILSDHAYYYDAEEGEIRMRK